MHTQWYASITGCATCSKLFEPFDLDDYRAKHREYASLSPLEKGQYAGAEDYVSKHGGPTLLPLNHNYMRLMDEIIARIENKVLPKTLPIDLVMQKDAIFDLLASLENENHIKEIYKSKKQKFTGELKSTTALHITDCIKQGRSLLHAGSCADILAKPLIDFYAACAYAYAIIVINSPLHKAINTLKGSHGHTYNHAAGTIEFGGEIPSGTFLDLLCALPVTQVYNQSINLKYSILPSINLIQKNNIKLSLLTLLSMVPELNEFYTQIDPDHHLVHKLSIDTGIVNSSVTYNFYIGDGITKPQKNRIEQDFRSSTVVEHLGSYQVSVPAEQIANIMPCIYQDIGGQLWYIESPVCGLVLPELCLHFLIISALCNIMRYSPHEWSNILSNKISSQYSLLISKYLRLFELKYPMLVSELITDYTPRIIWR